MPFELGEPRVPGEAPGGDGKTILTTRWSTAPDSLWAAIVTFPPGGMAPGAVKKPAGVIVPAAGVPPVTPSTLQVTCGKSLLTFAWSWMPVPVGTADGAFSITILGAAVAATSSATVAVPGWIG